MLKIKEYVKAKDLEEAYQLNQKRSSCVLGGMLWLKMGNRNVGTAIDLSGLSLDAIEETEEEFRIGAMVSLRDLETHEGLNGYTQGAMKESLRHIVGVQFRNCATVGGSIFGRFGFSDVLTMFLAMDSYVELYKGGILSLAEFAERKRDRDILVRILVKKQPVKLAYLSQRNSSTDFPVLACAAFVCSGGKSGVCLGARPQKAVRIEDKEGILQDFLAKGAKEREEAAKAFARYAKEQAVTGSNMRASGEYRSALAEVLTRRSLLLAAKDQEAAQRGGGRNGD